MGRGHGRSAFARGTRLTGGDRRTSDVAPWGIDVEAYTYISATVYICFGGGYISQSWRSSKPSR